MHKTIEQALQQLEQADFAGYFAQIDQLLNDLEGSQKTTYHKFKNTFFDGNSSNEFAQRLRTFAREIDNYLKKINYYAGTHQKFKVINTSQDKDWLIKLEQSIQSNQKLVLLVLTSTAEDFNTHSEAEIPLQHYGNAPENWKPYSQEQEILHLLSDFQQKSQLSVEVYFIQSQKFKRRERHKISNELRHEGFCY